MTIKCSSVILEFVHRLGKTAVRQQMLYNFFYYYYLGLHHTTTPKYGVYVVCFPHANKT